MRPVHFEIQADDLVRAQAFYGAVFGWRFDDYSAVVGASYFGVVTGDKGTPGIDGGLLPRAGAMPAPGAGANAFVVTIQVDNYDAVAEQILAHGGQVAQPKTALIGMAWQGYFFDTEGNIFGLHQADPSAC